MRCKVSRAPGTLDRRRGTQIITAKEEATSEDEGEREGSLESETNHVLFLFCSRWYYYYVVLLFL